MKLLKVDDKTGALLNRLIADSAHKIRLWMFKLGWDKDARKAFWMRLAETETDEYEPERTERPKIPVDLIPESGEGIGYSWGLVTWARFFPIGPEGERPYDYPINNAQVLDFQKKGYRVTLNKDGSGFSYLTTDGNSDPEAVAEAIRESFHLEPTINWINRVTIPEPEFLMGKPEDKEDG